TGRRGKVAERTSLGQRLVPPLQLFVHRLRPMEQRLVRRDVLEGLGTGNVSGTDLDRAEPRQHVELGEEDLGQAVQASCVPNEDGVEPSAPSLASGGGAELLPPLPPTPAVGARLPGGWGGRAPPPPPPNARRRDPDPRWGRVPIQPWSHRPSLRRSPGPPPSGRRRPGLGRTLA